MVNCSCEPYDVYIGEGADPRTGLARRWSGPLSSDGALAVPAASVAERQESVARYAGWLAEEVDAGRVSLEELAALDGQRLGCDCAAGPCHGEVLVRASEWAVRMLAAGPNVFWDLRPATRGGRFR